MRIGYGSQRFSEDLDFDNWGLTPEEFEVITEKVKQDLLGEGYEVEIRHIYKGAFHCIIKIPQLLFDNELASMATEKLTIKIDTVAQGIEYQPEVKVLQQFGIISPYKIAAQNVLLSMKLSAFFERVKGRDLFDIVYLLSL
ncbi:MAG: nucleotidyl transferase AbiEii/AbiGii toxin family protein [Candidatus Peribacteria bacterium]|nr:nucleotidyl transferase AbiEii/AbiGii toxin family protein [Candidatus Peribacteria bacterium]